jgi:hypothetical protein
MIDARQLSCKAAKYREEVDDGDVEVTRAP